MRNYIILREFDVTHFRYEKLRQKQYIKVVNRKIEEFATKIERKLPAAKENSSKLKPLDLIELTVKHQRGNKTRRNIIKSIISEIRQIKATESIKSKPKSESRKAENILKTLVNASVNQTAVPNSPRKEIIDSHMIHLIRDCVLAPEVPVYPNLIKVLGELFFAPKTYLRAETARIFRLEQTAQKNARLEKALKLLVKYSSQFTKTKVKARARFRTEPSSVVSPQFMRLNDELKMRLLYAYITKYAGLTHALIYNQILWIFP